MGRYDQIKDKKSSELLVAVVIVLIVLAGAAAFYFSEQQPGSSAETDVQALAVPVVEGRGVDDSFLQTEPGDETTDAAAIEELQPEAEQYVLPTLDSSDGQFRESMIQISPELSQWLNTDQLIRKYVVIANDFSQGLILEKHMRFLKPGQPFAADQEGAELFIATKSYQRYDKLAAAIDKIDAQAALAIYKKFRPLLLQVYTGFSYPQEHSLEDIFTKAAAEILAAPVIDERIVLVRPTVSYKFADQKLEALSPVQKQMIRMGPENTRIIQDKVRMLVEGLVN